MKYLFFLAILCNSYRSTSQNTGLCLLVKNENLRFTIWNISPVFNDSEIIVEPNIVVHVSIPDSIKRRFKNISVNEWINLLENIESDWAANLILYEIYEKNALVFEFVKKREDWVRMYRKEDIEYWKQKLKGNR